MVNVAAYRPRPGLTLIPDGLEAHAAQAVAGSRTAAVEIWSGPAGGAPEWVFSGGREMRDHGTLLTPEPIAARIQRLLTERELEAGEQDVTTRRYLVALPHDTTVALGSLLKVIDSGDPLLDGRYLSVVDAQGGSLRIERHAVCVDNMEAPLTPEGAGFGLDEFGLTLFGI